MKQNRYVTVATIRESSGVENVSRLSGEAGFFFFLTYLLGRLSIMFCHLLVNHANNLSGPTCQEFVAAKTRRKASLLAVIKQFKF